MTFEGFPWKIFKQTKCGQVGGGEEQGRVAGFVLPTPCGMTSVCRS